MIPPGLGPNGPRPSSFQHTSFFGPAIPQKLHLQSPLDLPTNSGEDPKKRPSSVSDKRSGVEPESCGLSIARQGELLGLPRSTSDYERATDSAANLELMRRIDEQSLETPF